MRPYICPVCQGRGTVPAGFYSGSNGCGTVTTTSMTPETCRACKGEGILWGMDMTPPPPLWPPYYPDHPGWHQQDDVPVRIWWGDVPTHSNTTAASIPSVFRILPSP